MKSLTLAALAALLIGTAPQPASAFSLSFVEGLLSDLGVSVDLPEVNIDLPPNAEEAVSDALGRVESVLDGIDLPNLDLPNVDLPEINLPEASVPNVDQIVQDAINQANAARANAQQRAQSAIDDALGRAESLLGDLDLPTIPQIDLPQVNVPDVQQIVDDALSDASDVLDGINVDLPNVQSIVDDALGQAAGILNGVLDDVNGTDVATIAKAIDEIGKLSGTHDATGHNQLARWVATKEQHATKIQETIASYFMAQRIKPDAEGYDKTLKSAHAVIIAAMKVKQAADPATAATLEKAIKDLYSAYNGKPYQPAHAPH